jgi:glycine/D-amino acid oxidase-like deaminating enzyme
MTKMIVIGAGVMGASVAFRLAQAGADVTVIEATRIGGGTSGISFAWINTHKKPPRSYHDLNVGGIPLRVLRARTSDPARPRPVVGEGVRSCPRAQCGKSACCV